jgi:hypothetical protein
MSHAYRLSNLKVLSDIELPELMPWTGASNMSDEVFFRVGEIPAGQSSAGPAAGGSELPDGHRCLLTLGDKGKVLVENGREVIIEPAEGADPTDTRAVIMGPIQAVIWHQRGLVPLHASAISMNGRAVALAGPSGVGKSTLAAAFSTRGYAVLSDDICIVDTRNGATVLPSTPRLRLWRQALDHFGFPPDGLPRALSRSEKYLIEGNWAGAEQQQLAAVILLSRGAYREVAVRALRGWRSFSSLQGVVHMFGLAHSLGLDAAIFAALGKMFGAGVTVWELSLPDDLACLDQAVEKASEVACSYADAS